MTHLPAAEDLMPMMSHIVTRFFPSQSVESCVIYGRGHINKTYLVTLASGKRYILQKINTRIFRNVEKLMDNVSKIIHHLDQKADDPRCVLHLVHTLDGQPYVKLESGAVWRAFEFVEHSVCLQAPETPSDFYESAVAFGRFQEMLQDFPADQLHETIPNFHHTPDRYRIFREVLEADPMGRAKDVQKEIEFVLAREAEADTLVRMLEDGKLPLRVTHNDTKLNNVMLDADTHKALCVIDLDTVMPGLSLYDFGDSIRFGAATAAEDEQDLSKVSMDLTLFETYTRGFLQACPGLTCEERRMLPMGAKLMTLECGLRFLTDHLDGDNYFSIQREGQNLDRARTQLKMVADMEAKWAEMEAIVRRLCGSSAT